jgi:hypothetical protein
MRSFRPLLRPAAPTVFPFRFRHRFGQSLLRIDLIAVYSSSVKMLSFKEMKRQEAESRMAAVRKARRSPQAAAKLQHRASLVGDGAKWRITNLNQVARAIARWP